MTVADDGAQQEGQQEGQQEAQQQAQQDAQQGGQQDAQKEGQPDAPGAMREFSDEEVAQIEEERTERLDPDNRPPNAEVDNTDREFDVVHGRFTDSEPPEGGDFEFDPSAE